MTAGSGSLEVWSIVATALRAEGVDHIFGLPGDDMSVLRAFADAGIEFHLVRDQRHALYQAMGFAHVTGGVAVGLIGKGPAITHSATGVLEARAARVPSILITTGVAVDAIGSGAFQELDALKTLAPLAVGGVRVRKDSIVADVASAFRLTNQSGRGPVVLEVPEDLAAERSSGRPQTTMRSAPTASASSVPPLIANQAERPVLILGSGVRRAGVASYVLEWAETLGAGILATASGRGIVDESHPLFLGLVGLYATSEAKSILARADLVIALGSRLEETALFEFPTPQPTMIQVLDNGADMAMSSADYRVLADLAHVVPYWAGAARQGHPKWRAEVEQAHDHARIPVSAPSTSVGSRARVADLLSHLDTVVPNARVSVHENGLQDMWSYKWPAWKVRGEADCLVPSEQTPLGFGIMAAVGVAHAEHRPVVAIVGDGAFAAAGADLRSLASAPGPLLVVVLVNGGFGWLEANRIAANAPKVGFTDGVPNLELLCAAYHLEFVLSDSAQDMTRDIERAWHLCRAGGVVVLAVAVDLDDVPPGMEQVSGDFPRTAEDTSE